MQVQPLLSKPGRSLTTQITTDPALRLAAQRLRYAVFSKEYGADLDSATPGVDADRFDEHCDHVLVIDQETGEVVATTRILHGRTAARIGGFYSEEEFDLSRLKANAGTFAELGRTCVHPDYRSGTALSQMWLAVSQYLIREQIDYLIGCASISMLDGGGRAWRVAQQLQAEHLAPERFRATPRRALPHLANSTASVPVKIPPLIRTYMRLGAQVCGAPCWDPSFRCADMLVLLKVEQIAGRFARKYLRQ